MGNQSKAEKHVYVAGYVTGRRSARSFLEKLQESGLADDDSQAFLLADWVEKPEMVTEAILESHTTTTHSLAELVIGGFWRAWPKRSVNIINPPSPKSSQQLIKGGRSILVSSFARSLTDQKHRELIASGLFETVRNPSRTISLGRLGVQYDAIGRLSKDYDKLGVQELPEVTVVTSNNEILFDNDDFVATRIIMAGFKHVRVEGCHNVPYINSDVVIGALQGEKV